MLVGVRVGDMSYLPTSFRWGYGWEFPRLYGELTTQELKTVAAKSSHIFNPCILSLICCKLICDFL